MSASVESSVAPLEIAAARVEADGRVLAEALTLRLRGPRVVLVGDASAVLGPLLRRAHVARGLFRVFNQDILLTKLPIALVPRDPPLPPDLTPLAFVTWSVRLGQGLPRGKAADAAAEACDRVGLGADARVRLARSSLLTRRLTLLAHAAALAPRLAVIEEPLEGLGPDEIGTLLRAIDRAVGSACALVSTPRADAASPGHVLARGANEVVLLEGGRVLGQGRPDEVFTVFAAARPAPSLAPSSGLGPMPGVGPVSSLAPASSFGPVTSLAPAMSVGAPPSQRMTRLAPEPTKAPSAPEPPPASQRTTRLPDAEVLRLSALASAALHPNAEPAPLTRRAPGVEPAFARAILADLESPAVAKAPRVAPAAPLAAVLPGDPGVSGAPVASVAPTTLAPPPAPPALPALPAPPAPPAPNAPTTLAPPALVAPDAPTAPAVAGDLAVPAAPALSEDRGAEVSPPPPSPSAPARTSEASRPSDERSDPEKHDALGRPARARRSRYVQGGQACGSDRLCNPHCPASDS